MPILSPNQLNHNEITDQENNINATEQSAQHLSRLQNEIGSKVLALVNFESKHKDIVESSFNKARQNKEKLPGKNNERRNFAYLSRLDRMIEKHGDAIEQKLWEASAENLVMDYEDIPDAYWKQQEQILRDNGQGRELSRREKEILAKDLIDKQRQSITSWANYLGDKDCPYPTWFKVYAFDGISKMSNTLNLDDADYNRRDNTTALSFPKLNAEILAKVYRQINDFYGVDKENWLAQHSDDEKLVSLVKSANFPKLYAKELVDTKVILKTPERTEDVHGDWFEYKLGDEEEIASLAEGTRWCVVDPNVAHSYLTYGEYRPSRNTGADEESSSKAKFIIFRLEDPNAPGVFASNGSASIRLDPDGKVAEVSGLNDGQAVEDSLIPIVKEKTLSLPGGEKYLQKFDDKQALIRLDKKMEKGEDLTKEELSFLYELDRPIATLDTYNREDPRIPELKEKYGIEYALEKGVDANKMVASLKTRDAIKNLDTLLEHGANINNVVSNMRPDNVAYNLDTLLKHGADINVDELVLNLDSHSITRNLDKLLRNGADIDVNELVSSLDPKYIAYNLGTLLRNGADINNVVREMDSDDVIKNLDTLLKHGTDINNVVSGMDRHGIADNLDTLLEYGADINNVVSKMYSYGIADNLDILLRNGADIDVNELVSSLRAHHIAKNLDTLIKHGADINNVVREMDSDDVVKNLDTFLEHGADINNVVSKMLPDDVAKNLDTLLEHGADINNVVSKMGPNGIVKNLDYLLKNGADINNVISGMDRYGITDNLDTLLEHGADINNVVSKMRSNGIVKNLDYLLKNGADINNVVSNIDRDDVAKNLDYLLDHGADINNVVSKMYSYGIVKNLDYLLGHGADIDNAVSRMDSYDAVNKLDYLLDHGADIDNVIKRLDKRHIKDNIDLLRKYGANLDAY